METMIIFPILLANQQSSLSLPGILLNFHKINTLYTIYKCENCNDCPYRAECIKGNNCKTPLEERTKTLQVAKTFLKQRKADLERIISAEGALYRMNRSIQVEGSFGDIKQDMQFRRYLTKGTKNVLAESTLLAIARNINKLHNKIQNEKTGTHLFPLKTA